MEVLFPTLEVNQDILETMMITKSHRFNSLLCWLVCIPMIRLRYMYKEEVILESLQPLEQSYIWKKLELVNPSFLLKRLKLLIQLI
jgi:hypothetical protein